MWATLSVGMRLSYVGNLVLANKPAWVKPARPSKTLMFYSTVAMFMAGPMFEGPTRSNNQMYIYNKHLLFHLNQS